MPSAGLKDLHAVHTAQSCKKLTILDHKGVRHGAGTHHGSLHSSITRCQHCLRPKSMSSLELLLGTEAPVTLPNVAQCPLLFLLFFPFQGMLVCYTCVRMQIFPPTLLSIVLKLPNCPYG